jgi:hypothetical protein
MHRCCPAGVVTRVGRGRAGGASESWPAVARLVLGVVLVRNKYVLAAGAEISISDG